MQRALYVELPSGFDMSSSKKGISAMQLWRSHILSNYISDQIPIPSHPFLAGSKNQTRVGFFSQYISAPIWHLGDTHWPAAWVYVEVNQHGADIIDRLNSDVGQSREGQRSN